MYDSYIISGLQLYQNGAWVAGRGSDIFFLSTEHFESVSLHGYRRGLKSPLVAVGPFKFERKKFKFSESRRDADFEFVTGAHGNTRLPADS